MKWNKVEPKADIGDIVKIRGYDDLEYEVYSVVIEGEHNVIESFSEITYDVAAYASTGNLFNEYEVIHRMVYEEDLFVIERPYKVDGRQMEEYLAQRDVNIFDTLFSLNTKIFMNKFWEVDTMINQQPTQKELDDYANETIDELLTQLYDYKELQQMFGDDYEEGDGYYKRKIDDIKTELSKLTRKE